MPRWSFKSQYDPAARGRYGGYGPRGVEDVAKEIRVYTYETTFGSARLPAFVLKEPSEDQVGQGPLFVEK